MLKQLRWFFLPAVSTAVSNQRPSFYINYKQLFRNICDDAFCWSVIFDKSSKVFLQKVDKKQLLIGKSDNYVENSIKPWPKTLKKDNTTTIKQWLSSIGWMEIFVGNIYQIATVTYPNSLTKRVRYHNHHCIRYKHNIIWNSLLKY